MYAARSHHIDRVIRPALAEGAWVVCDRFVDATTAYQGAGHSADAEFLGELAKRVLQGLKPDLTLLLDAPLDIGFARIRHREQDHFEQEDREQAYDPRRVKKRMQAMQLIHPEGMGRTFKVLMLSKGCTPPPDLSGMQDPFAG